MEKMSQEILTPTPAERKGDSFEREGTRSRKRDSTDTNILKMDRNFLEASRKEASGEFGHRVEATSLRKCVTLIWDRYGEGGGMGHLYSFLTDGFIVA